MKRTDTIKKLDEKIAALKARRDDQERAEQARVKKDMQQISWTVRELLEKMFFDGTINVETIRTGCEKHIKKPGDLRRVLNWLNAQEPEKKCDGMVDKPESVLTS